MFFYRMHRRKMPAYMCVLIATTSFRSAQVATNDVMNIATVEIRGENLNSDST